MKNITKVVVLALVMIVFHVNTYAQKSEQQRMTREQLAETQAQFIANEMAMDNKIAPAHNYLTVPKRNLGIGSPAEKREVSSFG